MSTDRKPEFFAGKGLKIGIIGCGYVGLPLALRFAEVGQIVTGFDTDHSGYDYDAIVRHSKLIVDSRNATRRVTANREKIAHC